VRQLCVTEVDVHERIAVTKGEVLTYEGQAAQVPLVSEDWQVSRIMGALQEVFARMVS
jgi:hypothetical protein